MRRLLAIGGALVCLAFAGLATAGVVVTGDNNGTLTRGQSYVVSVNDVLAEIYSQNLGYLVATPCIGPGTFAWTLARGQWSVGANNLDIAYASPDLTVACSGIDWEYSGSVTGTAPTDPSATNLTISVTVSETMPSSNGNCAQPCLPVNSYSFSQTYPLVAANGPSTSNSASSPGQVTTMQPPATTTSPAPITSTTPPQTVTVTNPASTVTVTTSATAPPPVVTYIINVPSTITIQQTGNTITITITSNDRRSLQTLCWHSVSATQSNCASSTYGVWRVKLRKTPGKRVFLLKAHGKVVARKTVNVRVKS